MFTRIFSKEANPDTFISVRIEIPLFVSALFKLGNAIIDSLFVFLVLL